jgi:putative flippase GtrA
MLKIQLIKFIFVGVVNTIVGYCFYALFIFLGFDYTYALGIATVLGVIFNFQTIGRLVFKHNNKKLIFKFLLVYVVVFGVNLLLIKGLVWFGLNEYIGGAIAILPASAFSFILNKYFVFKR